MRKFALFISAISNPLFISIPFSYFLVLRTSGDPAYSLAWTIISMSFAGLVGLFVLYGVKRGFFSDYDVTKRQERPPLFAFTGIITVLYFIAIFILNGPKILLVSLGALLFAILLAEIINTKIKASMHMAVFSSLSLVLIILYGGAFWLLLLFAPVVAWSRLRLKRHTPREIVAGTILGITIVFAIYLVVKYIILVK